MVLPLWCLHLRLLCLRLRLGQSLQQVGGGFIVFGLGLGLLLSIVYLLLLLLEHGEEGSHVMTFLLGLSWLASLSSVIDILLFLRAATDDLLLMFIIDFLLLFFLV